MLIAFKLLTLFLFLLFSFHNPLYFDGIFGTETGPNKPSFCEQITDIDSFTLKYYVLTLWASKSKFFYNVVVL